MTPEKLSEKSALLRLPSLAMGTTTALTSDLRRELCGGTVRLPIEGSLETENPHSFSLANTKCGH